MLDREFDLDVERLSQERGDNTSFFAFADTGVARSYRGTNECHGWMGIKFQSRVNDEPSQIVMHVRMLDEEGSAQQEALGTKSIAMARFSRSCAGGAQSLPEVTTGRTEIDMFEPSGMTATRQRIMALKLVQLRELAPCARNREVLQPSDMLHNKAVLVERQLSSGYLRQHRHDRLCPASLKKNSGDTNPSSPEWKTGAPRRASSHSTVISLGARNPRLRHFGAIPILEYHRSLATSSWRTRESIGITGVPSIELPDEKHYTHRWRILRTGRLLRTTESRPLRCS
jgi:hypothetical protein